MADQQPGGRPPIGGALSVAALDPSKINPVGADPQELQAFQQAQQDYLNTLQQRYAQPNWFNIAAGFAKPQLGGFTAALGSAAQAAGQDFEQRRQAALAMAQMRAQIAQSNIGFGQRIKAAHELQQAGGNVTPGLVAQLDALAPGSPAAQAAKAQLDAQTTRQGQIAQQVAALTSMAALERQAGNPQWESHLQQAQTLQKQLQAVGQPPYAGALGAPPVTPGGGGVPSAAAPSAGAPSAAAPTSGAVPAPTPGAELNTEYAKYQVAPGQQLGRDQEAFKLMQDERSKYANDPVMSAALDRNIQAMQARIAQESAGAANAAAPGQPAASAQSGTGAQASQGPVQLPSAVPGISPNFPITEMPPAFQQQIHQQQAIGQQQYANTLSDQDFTNYQMNIRSAMDLIKKNPVMAQAALGLLQQQGGLKGGILNALQTGVSGNVGGAGFHLNAPVQAFLEGSLTPAERQLRDTLATKLAQINLESQKLGGLNQNTARNVELHLSTAAAANPNMQANTILYLLGSLENQAGYSNALRHRVDAIVNGTDKQYSAKGSPTAYADVFSNKQLMSQLSSAYDARQKAMDDNYSRLFGGR